MFEQLREKFPLPPEQWDTYVASYHRMEVPARTVLLREGDISRKAFLIEEGCLRIWFNHGGKDITFQFFFEGEGVSSVESFRKKMPSIFSIEAIEPSVIHWIDKEDMDTIMHDMLDIPSVRSAFLDTLFERQFLYMKHFLSLIKDTPSQRYKNLIEEKPHIVHRVPQHYIASYLGITPVSLSRIRSKFRVS